MAFCEMKFDIVKWSARVLALLWAGWWMFFGLACGASHKWGLFACLLHGAVPGGIYLVSALVPWRWPLAGGVLLVVEGSAILIGYPVLVHGRFRLSTILFVAATMAAPPLISGALFIFHGRRSRSHDQSRAGAGRVEPPGAGPGPH